MSRVKYGINTTKKMTLSDARNALLTYLIAKHENGAFIINILDYNEKNYNYEVEEFAYKVLNYLGLQYDEGPTLEGDYGPYNQKFRLNDYKEFAEKLLKKNKAYYCFCTREELDHKRMKAVEEKTSYKYDGTCRYFPKDEARRRILLNESHVIRTMMPTEGQTTFHDLVFKDVTVPNQDIRDAILIKNNGLPTYVFASVVDDCLLGITHVTNSNTFLNQTPIAYHLFLDLDFPLPEFVHFPIFHEKKEDTLEDILKQGFLSSAIINYLALNGWNPKTNQELFTLEELINLFTIENITTREAHFDLKKLEWFNHQHIMKMSDEDYLEFIKPYLRIYYNIDDKSEEWVNHLLLLYKNRLRFGAEIGILTHLFFDDIILETEDITYLKENQKVLENFKGKVPSLDTWNMEDIVSLLKQIEEEMNLDKSLIYMPIRLATTGCRKGPDLYDCLYLIGKEKVLERLLELF